MLSFNFEASGSLKTMSSSHRYTECSKYRRRKPLLTLTLSLLIIGAPAFARGNDKEVAAPSFPIGSKLSRGLQKYSGINFLTEVVSNQVLKYAIKKQVGGKVKVRIKTYSLTDLIAGKVKAANVFLENSVIEGMAVSSITCNTKMPTWFTLKRVNRSHLKSPVAINVQGSVSQEDVTNALASHKVISSLRGLKLDLPGLGEQQLDIIDPEVSIQSGLLKIKGTLITRGGAPDTGVPIVITGEPKLEGNQRLVINNLKVESDYIVEPDKFARFVSELINPIVDFGRYDRTTHAFRLSSFEVKQEEVAGLGELILVPPKTQIVTTGKENK